MIDAAHSNDLGMSESALLLIDSSTSRQDRCVAKVFEFFGVPSRNLNAADFPFANDAGSSTSQKIRLLSGGLNLFILHLFIQAMTPALCKS